MERRWRDAALALGATLWHLLAWVASATDRPHHPLGVNLVALALPTLPLYWRRTRPMTAFAAVAAGYLVWYFVAGPDMSGQIAVFFVGIALYSAARYAPARRSLVAAAVTAVLLALPDLYGLTRESGDVPRRVLLGAVVLVFLLAIPVCVWSLGWGQRRLRERAVLAERARIARDLHDVVAHHVSAIAILARTAEVLFDENPLAARTNLALLGGTADTALTDMRRLVGILDAVPDFEDLVRPLEASGYQVVVDRDAGDLDPAVEIAAYRIVQEGLTNIMKHVGPTRVRVIIHQTRTTLKIVVENDEAPRKSLGGSGRGLIGVRERAAQFGGACEAGPRQDGGWRRAVSLRING